MAEAPEAPKNGEGCLPCLKMDRSAILKRKELYLAQKEKQILKMEKKLNEKLRKYKKSRAEAGLQPAIKLDRKKVHFVGDTTEVNKEIKLSEKTSSDSICEELSNEPQRKWCMLQKFNKSTALCFCDKSRELYDLFLKKIRTPCSCEDRSAACECCKEFKTYRRQEMAAQDYCDMLLNRNRPICLWEYGNMGIPPVTSVYPRCQVPELSLRNLGLCLLFIGGILFWAPCILCIVLCKCCCCSCCYNCI
ncbi:hypothetical protein B5X24_HaOG216620 [Helicoverpa armigera]|nr:hypothetical protein B5X24_HaOG216620 [Helicoverpa armigera]